MTAPRRSILGLITLCFFAAAVRAEPSAASLAWPDDYEKKEYLIPMRDGVRLWTIVHSPKDTSRKYPVLLRRTPYSATSAGDPAIPQSTLAPANEFLRNGYIFVIQDVRGRYRSEGEWQDFRPLRQDRRGIDETTDTYDTIEWLLREIPNHNGRVGQWGISYDGWYTVMGMIDPHPALRAASPQATSGDLFVGDDYHHNGAFILMILDWAEHMSSSARARGERYAEQLPGFDSGTSWAYEFFLKAGPTSELNEKYFGGRLGPVWTDVIQHPDYDDYWRRRNALTPLKNIKVPVLNVMGWFDTFDPYGAMATYQAIERSTPKNRSTVVAGPWRHGGWSWDSGAVLGDIEFGSKTGEHYRQQVALPFFEYHLRGTPGWKSPEAIMFATGSNTWHALEQWPPKTISQTPLYLGANGSLSLQAPSAELEAFDSYLSDPGKPVPFSTQITNVAIPEWRIADQRLDSTRPDVLTYESEPLARDLTIAGPISVELFASTSGTDSDWVVKLIDVFPRDPPETAKSPGGATLAGYQMLVGMDLMRGKYRNGFSKPVPMTPGEVTPIRFDILDKFHTFKQGHRIRVHVQSSFFPYIDRNPQTFTNIYSARAEDYRAATQKIHRSTRYPSRLSLPVLLP